LIYHKKPGQHVGGHAIGILVLQLGYPIIPGNVANATTFDFPVRYGLIKTDIPGVNLFLADEGLLDPILTAAQALAADGVKAIVGSCGYLGFFQKEVAKALDIPVFMTSLLQIPMILPALKPTQKLGVICANEEPFYNLLESLGLNTIKDKLEVKGLENEPEFTSAILGGSGVLDNEKLGQEVVSVAQSFVSTDNNVGAILLECSDIPPYAKQISSVTGVPVFDYITFIEWIYRGLVKRDYHGFI